MVWKPGSWKWVHQDRVTPPLGVITEAEINTDNEDRPELVAKTTQVCANAEFNATQLQLQERRELKERYEKEIEEAQTKEARWKGQGSKTHKREVRKEMIEKEEQRAHRLEKGTEWITKEINERELKANASRQKLLKDMEAEVKTAHWERGGTTKSIGRANAKREGGRERLGKEHMEQKAKKEAVGEARETIPNGTGRKNLKEEEELETRKKADASR